MLEALGYRPLSCEASRNSQRAAWRIESDFAGLSESRLAKFGKPCYGLLVELYPLYHFDWVLALV